jgi:hypothetical protein
MSREQDRNRKVKESSRRDEEREYQTRRTRGGKKQKRRQCALCQITKAG